MNKPLAYSFCMILHFLIYSLDLEVVRAQMIMGFLILITHKSTGSESLIRWKARSSLSYWHKKS